MDRKEASEAVRGIGAGCPRWYRFERYVKGRPDWRLRIVFQSRQSGFRKMFFTGLVYP